MLFFGQNQNAMATAARLEEGNPSILSCFSCDRLPATLGVAASQMPTSTRQQQKNGALSGTEDFLASEMQRLSVMERSKALDDLHCVGEDLKETPEMAKESLAQFDQVVQDEKNPYYEMAAAQNRAYVEDPTFRLKFLRANLHNVHRSVRQMYNFLRYKGTYFGNDKIARDITLDDLDEEDKKLMLSGLFHVQDGRDQTGRVVVYLLNTFLGKCKAENVVSDIDYEMQMPTIEVIVLMELSPIHQLTPP